MKQIINRKNLDMYTATLDEEGTLQIQAPTLLKPFTLPMQQAQELALWLMDAYQLAISQQPEQFVVPPDATYLSDPTANEILTSQYSPAPTIEPLEQPQEIALRVISEAISQARAQYPAVLEPENRDRFLNQILRAPEIKPLLSQSRISRKQILLLVEQKLA